MSGIDSMKRKQTTSNGNASEEIVVNVLHGTKPSQSQELQINDKSPRLVGGKKESRFIVFIGNLPYSVTKAALENHFRSVEPTSIRLITKKDDPTTCKGFAFLEFERYDRMKLCLEKYHHSLFQDGISEGRKINVELTAGGGGKSKRRQLKLQVKNRKLNEERLRHAAARAKEKIEQEGRVGHPRHRRRIK